MTPPPNYLLGIDPGLSGALCLLHGPTKSIQTIFDMPTHDGRVDPYKLAQLVNQLHFLSDRDLHAVVEQVSSMPRQSGAFNFGLSAGVVHGVLGALGIPFTLIPPHQWKPAMGLRRLPNETQQQNKARARQLAIELWPDQADQFKRVKDDGRAEAGLLSRYFANKLLTVA
jgi:crossover junction endodeoxyribonuclease RuvC